MNPIWIGIDDTDSVRGGCTTYVANALINRLVSEGYDLIGYPRLVRLNPNIPWKTRGNGALAFRIGKGRGKKYQIGESNGQPLYAYSSGTDGVHPQLFSLVTAIVRQYARLDDTKTNPGVVILKKQPKKTWYLHAVREIVLLKDVVAYLQSVDAEYKRFKNGRGLIGATAAIAWTPTTDKTYELIAYREQHKWGTPRHMDIQSVKRIDNKIHSTFDNCDYENKHNRLTPHSPCPILYGVRGDSPKDLQIARKLLRSEPVQSWIVFKTNQGTDDHLQQKKIKDIQPYQSVVVNGTVQKPPSTIRGGHVLFTINDDSGVVTCAAYEPTKQFRATIRTLVPGDRITVYGGVRKHPLTINLEKICVHSLATPRQKVENPICPVCHKHMKSKGKNQGYKCKRCKTTSQSPRTITMKRLLKTGFYEVPVCARRHLSRPLKRMNK